MATRYDDSITFTGPVSFAGDVSFAQTPPEISLENLNNLSGTGTATFSDLVAEDDLTVGDDLSVAGDVAVTGSYTSAAGNITLTAGTMTAANVVSTDDIVCGDDLSVAGDVAVTGDLAVGGEVDLSAATLVLPPGMALVRTWTSGTIVHGDLTGGGAQDSVAVPTGDDGAWPSSCIVLGAYLETTVEVTSSSANTTGLTASLASSSSSYLTAGSSILGAAGKKSNPAGTLLGGLRISDSPTVNFTATGGGSEDLADIDALGLRVVILYVPIA